MNRISLVVVSLGILVVLSLVAGCAKPPPTNQTPGGATFGSMSQSGQAVFASNCARCHGANGEGKTGPALIGVNASIDKYNTGKGLLDYISTAMPLNAPGSLSHQDYLEILSFLLVQNDFAAPTTAFEENALPGLQLK